MKTRILALVTMLAVVIALVAMSAGPVAAQDGGKGNNGCIKIKDGSLNYSAGHYLEDEPLQLGYDPWGYNYQAHLFVGSVANVYLGGAGFPPYDGDPAYLTENPGADSTYGWPWRDNWLVMKWNDAWLSNKDCDGDGKLDRHYGFTTYSGSGAWLTNYEQGWDEGRWTYFCKIVAAPADADKQGGTWYTADGAEIGPVIWGAFAIIQEVESGLGPTYLSPSGPGFCKW